MQRRWIRSGTWDFDQWGRHDSNENKPAGSLFFARPGRLGRESTNPITQSRYNPLPHIACLNLMKYFVHDQSLHGVSSVRRTGRVGRVLLYFGIGKEGKAAGGCDAQTCNMGIDVFAFLAAPRSPSPPPGLCPVARRPPPPTFRSSSARLPMTRRALPFFLHRRG